MGIFGKLGKWVGDRIGDGPSIKGLKSSIKGTGHFVGDIASNPLTQVALGAVTGGAALPVLAGVAGGALKRGGGLKGALKGGASAGLSAAGGPLGVLGKIPGAGKVGSAAGSVLSKIPGAERAVSIGKKVGGLGDVIQGTFPGGSVQGDPMDEQLPPVIIGHNPDGSPRYADGTAPSDDRYRRVSMGDPQQDDRGWLQTALGFLGDHKDDILDYGTAAEQVAQNHRRNKFQDEAVGMARGDLARRQPLRDQGMAGLLDQSRPDLSGIFADPDSPVGRYRRVQVGSR